VDFTELGSAERRGEFFGDETGAASKYSIFGRASSFCPLFDFRDPREKPRFPAFFAQPGLFPKR
jgi:hypothetical protein